MNRVRLHASRLLAASVVALWGAGAWAAAPYDTPPTPAAPRPLRIDAPREQTLPNGLRVVVAERRGLPLVSVQLLILSGSEVDPSQRAGLASITAGLLTKGTRRRSAPALASAAETLGGTIESAAGWDRSNVSITVTTPKLDAALALVAEVATEPAFAQTELERLRTQALDDLKVAYAKPGTLATLTATRMLFGDGAYGKPATGTPTSLQRLTRADVTSLYRSFYRPDNAVLVLAGDVDLAAGVRLAQRHFGRWRAPSEALPIAPAVVGAASDAPLAVVDMGNSGQAAVVLVLPVAARGASDHVAGDVANAVLGGDYSSRLNQEIRIKRGLSYGARSNLDARRRAGLLNASVQTKNESAAEVVALLQAQIDSLVATPVATDELAARKATLIGKFSRSVETTAGLSGQVASLVVAGISPSELQGRIASLSAVDEVAVQRYARAHFAMPERRVAVAGDAGRFEAALRTAVPGLVSRTQESVERDP